MGYERINSDFGVYRAGDRGIGCHHRGGCVCQIHQSLAIQTANQTGFVKAAMPDGAIANEVLIVGSDCDRPEGIRKKL